MGVQWDLLASVGRRVAVETLADKKLAIVHKGDERRQGRWYGTLICSASFGGFVSFYIFALSLSLSSTVPPLLSSVAPSSRRRLRENARAKIRKTAEKLLLNQLKSMRLKELAKDLEKQNAANKKGKQTKILEENKRVPEKLDEMLAASIAAEECGSLNNNASTSVAVAAVEEEDRDGDEEMILFENQSEKHKNNTMGKEILTDHTDIEGSNMGRDHMAAETSMVVEEEGSDGDEEMILVGYDCWRTSKASNHRHILRLVLHLSVSPILRLVKPGMNLAAGLLMMMLRHILMKLKRRRRLDSDVHDESSYPAKLRNRVSGGSIEDEAGLEDAIMRSYKFAKNNKFVQNACELQVFFL